MTQQSFLFSDPLPVKNFYQSLGGEDTVQLTVVQEPVATNRVHRLQIECLLCPQTERVSLSQYVVNIKEQQCYSLLIFTNVVQSFVSVRHPSRSVTLRGELIYSLVI